MILKQKHVVTAVNEKLRQIIMISMLNCVGCNRAALPNRPHRMQTAVMWKPHPVEHS